MKIDLKFSHDKKGAAIVSMSADGSDAENFDYVKFVKLLFANPDAEVSSTVDASYTEDQKVNLEEMAKKLEMKARGTASCEED